MQDLIKRVPIPISGLALGLAALGNLLQTFSNDIRLICGILATLLLALITVKTALYPGMIREDVRNPIMASVSATYMMTLMQLSCYIAPTSATFGVILWLVAVSAHLTLIIWFTKRFMLNLKLDQVFPTYFICYVGIIVACVTSPSFGFEPFAQVLFWFGFACFIPLLVLITVRYVKHPAPTPARPLFCIYSAPASLSIVGYLSVESNPDMLFVASLLIAAQILLIIVISRLPKLLSNGFYPSFAAMTFPFVITATALACSIELFHAYGMPIPSLADQLVLLETGFACLMVAFVFLAYMRFLFSPLVQSAMSRIRTEVEPAE